MSYYRVIPRDLFNEAKLLKCLGRIALLVHDEQQPGGIMIGYDGMGFNVHQDESDGGLFCSNFRVSIHGHYVHLSTQYNSKANYPLWCAYEDDDVRVFDEDGNWDPEFVEMVQRLEDYHS